MNPTKKISAFPKTHPEILFVQNGYRGKCTKKTLTITRMAPAVLFFSDRPARFSGHMTLEQFVTLWDKGKDTFKSNPPNAVLSYFVKGKPRNIVLELHSCKLKKERIFYKIKILSGKPLGKFRHANLFVDAYPTAVNNQITDVVTDSNVKEGGDSLQVTMSNSYQATGQALSESAHQATITQEQTNRMLQDSTQKGIAILFGLDTAREGEIPDILTEE